MTYEPKNFDYLLGISGFSEQLLKNHFILYQGYVTNTNKILETLNNLIKEGKIIEFAELKRRFCWEFNGMRLHELYFENITKEFSEIDRNSELFKKIEKDFGSFENWEKDFKTIGTMRGIGWVILYYDPKAHILLNVWINEHDVGHLVENIPILIMDVFEHAYMIDYGLRRADYIENFFKAINWKVLINRFKNALNK
ncbi:MAG: superoxide dismutase [Candidatus Aenigmatarchaeota archaeon]